MCNTHPLLAILLVTLYAPAAASDPALQRGAQDYLTAQIEHPNGAVRIDVAPPDANFPTCDDPRFFMPGNGQQLQGRVTVGVRCGARGRVRYLQAQVAITGRYWVAARAVAANTELDASLLEARHGDFGDLPRRAVRSLDEIHGRLARRPLRAGTVLQSSHLRTIPLVERRQTVTVEARGPGFSVSREGQALESGGEGDEIRVRLPNRDTVTAVVRGPGRVSTNW